MAPRRAEEVPIKRVAAFGCRLPARMPAGEILTDINQKSWRLGEPIGSGGFGDIYLASNDLHRPVGQQSTYVVKIEPHNNGPLFVEMNFYIRAARQHMIEGWCKSQGLRRIGVPTYEGAGSHVFNGERYRFLVLPRYGVDVNKLFLARGRKLNAKFVYTIAIQMLDALEYIHSRGYVHADVKGSNILLKLDGRGSDVKQPESYLLDYGLACRFRTRAGIHKPFVHDERRAHEGTLEFTSRDAHHGTHSRRGDLETLGYNLLQWLCGRLPWESKGGGMSPNISPEDIHAHKEILFSDVPSLMRECFPNAKNRPATLMEYLTYVTTLEFQTRPDYTFLRGLFARGICQEGNTTSSGLNKLKRPSNENMSYAEPVKRTCLRNAARMPCKPVNCEIRMTRNTQPTSEKTDFSWEAILSGHPDKLARNQFRPLSPPLTPPPSPPPPPLPTYAMLQVQQIIKERQAGIPRQRTSSKSNDDLKTKWMTPAMVAVAKLKKKAESITSSKSKLIPQCSPRLTRSRTAQLKNLQIDSKIPKKTSSCPSARAERAISRGNRECPKSR